VLWKGIGETPGVTNFRHSYKFTYDKANRLETAVSQTYYGTRWNREIGALNEQLSYDHNGNILTLQRNQLKYDPATPDVRTSEVMDNLTYTYETQQGNRLLKVEDASGNLAGFKNGANVATEYTYDVNGNTLTDQNKGIANVIYNIFGKPEQVVFSDGRKLQYVYDAGGTKLTIKTYQGTALQSTTDYVGSFVYENGTLQFFGSPEGRVVKNGSTLEHQYAIADHQGNTRVVFTSATPTADIASASFETPTNADFQNYGNPNGMEVFDHTDTGPTATQSQLLNGGVSGQVGLAKTLKVYPGDKVKVEAYSKYWNGSDNGGGLSAFASMLTTAFGVSSASTGDALLAYNTLSNYGGLVAAGTAHSSNAGDPKGFVTILLFDKNFNFLDAAWDQIDADYEQGLNITVKDAFDYLQKEVTVEEEGYAYVYLSNESPTLVDIHFDDVTVTHTKSRVIQYNEYYPFGLQTASSWTRENTTGNRFLYNQGSELNALSGWYETMFRDYDPALVRFMQVDPLAGEYTDITPYNYALNNPVSFNDPLGDRPVKIRDDGGEYSTWIMADGHMELVRNPFSIMDEFGDLFDDSWMDDHWSTPFQSVSTNFATMSIDDFKSVYSGFFGSDQGIAQLAQSMGSVTFTGSMAKSYISMVQGGGDYNVRSLVRMNLSGAFYQLDTYGNFFIPYTNEMARATGSSDIDWSSNVEARIERALITINEFNPVANGYDAILGYANGTDRFGNSQSVGESTIKAASALPWGKLVTYPSKFYRAFPAFKKFIGKEMMEIHHRIPQRYIKNGLFPESMRTSLSNLQALPYKIHRGLVTPEWNAFSAANPNATRAQIMKFAIEMDKKIAQYIGSIGR
jgi:RHS repeat-associated protein